MGVAFSILYFFLKKKQENNYRWVIIVVVTQDRSDSFCDSWQIVFFFFFCRSSGVTRDMRRKDFWTHRRGQSRRSDVQRGPYLSLSWIFEWWCTQFFSRVWIKHTYIVKDISADPTKYRTVHCCKSTTGKGPFILDDISLSAAVWFDMRLLAFR